MMIDDSVVVPMTIDVRAVLDDDDDIVPDMLVLSGMTPTTEKSSSASMFVVLDCPVNKTGEATSRNHEVVPLGRRMSMPRTPLWLVGSLLLPVVDSNEEGERDLRDIKEGHIS